MSLSVEDNFVNFFFKRYVIVVFLPRSPTIKHGAIYLQAAFKAQKRLGIGAKAFILILTTLNSVLECYIRNSAIFPKTEVKIFEK